VIKQTGGKKDNWEKEIRATVVKYTHGEDWYRWISPDINISTNN